MKSRLKTYTKVQWDILAWDIWRQIIMELGSSDIKEYGKKKVLKWYFDSNLWLKEYPKGKVQDLRGFGKFKVKDYEKQENLR